MAARATSDRVEATLRRLNTEANVWIATASSDGLPHLVPLSLGWNGTAILAATPTDSPTARNIVATRRARASLDSAEDVAVFDTDAEAVDLGSVGPEEIQPFVDRLGWDPRELSGDWSLLVFTPRRVHAWNGAQEIEGRTIMRGGVWLN